ncbi:MAG: hypothetical protein EPN25_11650 [Nitrospirae bacterium]|nr:MAG: hypothetical protein EPN25_11650 [Nitrospirota bacterium]
MSAMATFREICLFFLFLAPGLLSGCGGDLPPEAPHAVTGTFSLSLSSDSITTSPGDTRDLTVYLQSHDGFDQTVSVRCSKFAQGITLSPSTFTVSRDHPTTIQIVTTRDAINITKHLTLVGEVGDLRVSLPLDINVTYDNAGYIPEALDIPILSIDTTGKAPILSREDYIGGHLSIMPNGADASIAYDGDIQIRGRGHSTWLMPKKPYRIKLNNKAALFGFPASKDWVLLANYADKTLLRNVVAMELSSRLGMAYTPRSRSVELYLNGAYQGTYLFMESIKVAPGRVPIPSMSSTDISGEALTGGYLMEFTLRRDEIVSFTTPQGLPVAISSPDPPTPEQLTYISRYVNKAEDALFSNSFTDPENGYRPYIDTASFINWYLVNEVFSNVDAYFYSSCYFYKDRNGKLFMGPAWDFDLGAGNVDYSDARYPQGWYVRRASWINRMFQDPFFAQQVKARWNAIKTTQLDTLFAFIDDHAAHLEKSQRNNFRRWPILGAYVWPNPVIPGTYQSEVDYLKSWLSQRIAWMDAQFNP